MTSHRIEMKDLEARCEAAGLPLTLQRRAVIEALAARVDHPTADQVAADVVERHRGVSRATVYRALDAFVERGLAIKVCHPEAAARYDFKVHRHHHLVCDGCGAISDLEEPRFDKLSVPDTGSLGFRVRDYSVHLRGLCAACAKTEDEKHQP